MTEAWTEEICIIDPLGQPKVKAGKDHCFRTCCPSVRPHFSNLAKQNKTKTMSTSGRVDHWSSWNLFCFIRFWKVAFVRTYGQHVWKQWSLYRTDRDCGLVEWINQTDLHCRSYVGWLRESLTTPCLVFSKFYYCSWALNLPYFLSTKCKIGWYLYTWYGNVLMHSFKRYM